MKDSDHRGWYDSHLPKVPSRLRNQLKRWKRIIPFLALFLVVVIGGYFWLSEQKRENEQIAISADKQVNVGTGYRNITYHGKNYHYNNRITAILYAGVDSDTPLVQYAKYAMAPRADSISLIILDELHQKMTIVALSRDTMTKIRRYSLNGKKSGLYVDHLCFAYSYGNGGKSSCEGLCEAISLLLYGVPINDYVISNRASLSIIGELIGPVEVTVPNGDLEYAGDQYKKGNRVVVDTANLDFFVRHRDTTEYFSNEGRMQRQQAYINGAMDQFVRILTEDPNEFWKKLQAAEGAVQTNITRNRYLDLTRILKNTSYSSRDYYIPAGEQVAGKYHDEFYVDEDALLEKVIELFYIEQ